MKVTIVDAFTHTPGAGNRAALVMDEPGQANAPTTDVGKLAVARALALPATAFVTLGRERGPGVSSLELRYFTPDGEIPFCGHGTIAALHALGEIGVLPSPSHFTFVCPAGAFDAELRTTEHGVQVWLTTPQPPWLESPIGAETLMKCLGGSTSMLNPKLPLRQSGTKLFVPLARRSDLFALTPRWDELIAGKLGVLAFTRDVIEPSNVTHSRFFTATASHEDAVTGSASGPLASYLAMHRVLQLPAGGGTVIARAEQGDLLRKPGRIELEVTGAGTQVDRVRIGGAAIVAFSAEMSS